MIQGSERARIYLRSHSKSGKARSKKLSPEDIHGPKVSLAPRAWG